MVTRMKKGPAVAAAGPLRKAKHSRESTDRSTTALAQQARIVDALRRGPKTTDELRAIGAYQVSARIFGLRARGYEIVTELFDGYAADGYSHARMARYTLAGEPDGGAA